VRVFLTGGTGFIGKSLVQALIQRHWEVTVLVRHSDSAQAQAIALFGVRLVVGDVTDRESMRDAMTGTDVVIHNAGLYEFGLTSDGARQMQLINVDGTRNVLGLAHELGIAKIVHVSTIVALGFTGSQLEDESFERQQPITSVYESTKTQAHEVARDFQRQGAPVVIVSPGGVVGPGDHSSLGYLARMYVRGFGLPLMPTGQRATVYLDDCAQAIALSAEKGKIGENYILSGGVLSFQEMFETWKTKAGGPKFTVFLPKLIGELGCRLLEPLQRLFGLPNMLSREVFTTGSLNWCYSGAKAEREFNIHFRDGRQAWLDTLELERQRANAGQSWRNLD
jgi:dihydroflavonol-4-reductase